MDSKGKAVQDIFVASVALLTILGVLIFFGIIG